MAVSTCVETTAAMESPTGDRVQEQIRSAEQMDRIAIIPSLRAAGV